MSKNVLYSLAVALGLLAAVQVAPRPESVTRQDSAKRSEGSIPVAVSLSALRNTIVSGETLELKVEIWNKGPVDVYICKNFDEPYWPLCSISFSLEDPSGRYGPAEAVATDFSPWHKEMLSAALSRDWIALRPGHFYGAVIRIEPSSYPQLRKPGSYQVLGRYSSAGVLAYQGTVLASPEDLAHLPATSWQGEIETNRVVFHVAPKRK